MPITLRAWQMSRTPSAIRRLRPRPVSTLASSPTTRRSPGSIATVLPGSAFPQARRARSRVCAHNIVSTSVLTTVSWDSSWRRGPDAITPESLTFMRELGCTKVQIGVQGIRQDLLDRNGRGLTVDRIADTFALTRLYGFKIHAHFMLNLAGATPQADVDDYRAFATGTAFAPDEVKLYPCALVAGTGLMRLRDEGAWRPYTRDELVDILVRDIMATPAWTRVSRMIRDIPSTDIVDGNKQTNLRQMVEGAIDRRGLRSQVREIRMREIQGERVRLDDLTLEDVPYKTTVTTEHFIQWVTPEGGIAGFLRLSLPDQAYVRDHAADLRVGVGEAMIREAHVYGRSAHLGVGDSNAQHRGLGRRLVEEACRIARKVGCTSVNVISSVGTREYYRSLGFIDNGLYQRRNLVQDVYQDV